MEVKVDVAAITDKNAVLGLDAVLLESVDFVEEVGNVNNAAGANEVDATLGENARGQNVDIESGSVFHNGVAWNA